MELAIAACVALASTIVTVRPADACLLGDAHYREPPMHAAVANAIAVVTVTSVKDGVAEMRVDETLKSYGKLVVKNKNLRVPGVLANPTPPSTCRTPGVDVGTQYIVFLWFSADGTEDELVDGTGIFSITDRSAVEEAILRPPAWRSSKGFAAALVLDRIKPPAIKRQLPEIDLDIVVRNTGSAALTWEQSWWPRDPRSHCSLTIVSADRKTTVRPVDVPFSNKELEAEYSGRPTFNGWIAPNRSEILHLPSVTTAPEGSPFGYKEELGFRYYPITAHGWYDISATCENFTGPGKSFSTNKLRVTL